jgi:hypothetical protein
LGHARKGIAVVTVLPFRGLRPSPDKAAAVASPPYDVLNAKEAREMAKGNPISFLRVNKAELEFDDSTCDIPPQLMQDMGITVVPIYVVFGDKSYRDRLDIGDGEFYEKLIHGSVHPSTSIPTPKDFADVYNKLAQETDEIISIHITSKESGTYNAALLAKELVTKKCRIEVVDSLSMSMALGLSGG